MSPTSSMVPKTTNYLTVCWTATKNPIDVFPEKELRYLNPNFHIHVSVSALYSQDKSTYFPAAE